ncbi:hypothetical protein MPL3365_170215 [Mesorhizobium plurifarium]|uniref:Uncharacterized protein n=1 Tax=Mesorhizobium plurifarium TaxID=69974 RepID=A0A090G674_MESPL|nr:hypothetical protein MPL3365_170215 [Mesorhizobium plurifarium]
MLSVVSPFVQNKTISLETRQYQLRNTSVSEANLAVSQCLFSLARQMQCSSHSVCISAR